MNDALLFEIWFQVTLPGGEEVTAAGAWPEARPVPAAGDLMYLSHPALGEGTQRIEVMGLAAVYSPSPHLSFSTGDTTVPCFSKLLLVFAKVTPVSAAEGRALPPLRLVTPRL